MCGEDIQRVIVSGRSVVKYRGQGQSGQAIKLFQITPYVNDFPDIQQCRLLTA